MMRMLPGRVPAGSPAMSTPTATGCEPPAAIVPEVAPSVSHSGHSASCQDSGVLPGFETVSDWFAGFAPYCTPLNDRPDGDSARVAGGVTVTAATGPFN